MPGKLSPEDKILIEDFRESKILDNVDTHKIEQDNGVILVSCADGDQMPDLFGHLEKIIVASGRPRRIHTLALNGGPLLLAPTSPLNMELHEDWTLLQHIAVARQLKEINTVILCAHAPCGAAGMFHLNFFQVIRYLIEAKTLLKKSYTDIKVACYCHIDYGEEKRRTHFVSRERFENWQKANLKQPQRD